MSKPESNPEDQEILAAAGEVSQQLGFKNTGFRRAVWLIPGSRIEGYTGLKLAGARIRFQYDACRCEGSFVLLHAGLRGKLAAAEWSPLIASSLVYNQKLRPLIRRQLSIRAFLPIIVIGFLILSISFAADQYSLFDTSTRLLISSLGLLVYVVAVALIMLNTLHHGKRMRLAADLQAAETVGKDSLIQSLRKIDNAHLPDFEKLKRTMLARRGRPTVAERIQALIASKSS